MSVPAGDGEENSRNDHKKKGGELSHFRRTLCVLARFAIYPQSEREDEKEGKLYIIGGQQYQQEETLTDNPPLRVLNLVRNVVNGLTETRPGK